jgi:ribosome-associated heat shock protein Hsp15
MGSGPLRRAHYRLGAWAASAFSEVVFCPAPWQDEVMSETPPRLDKWLWAVRAFKTRSQAAEACRLGRVTIGGLAVKPARDVRVGDVIVVKQSDLTRSLKVLQGLRQRVGAALVKNYVEDLTPPSEYEKRRQPDFRPFALRPKGAGRPTKKERRALILPKD